MAVVPTAPPPPEQSTPDSGCGEGERARWAESGRPVLVGVGEERGQGGRSLADLCSIC